MSVVFHGTYHRLGAFDSATGEPMAASGSVAVTPFGGSTVTATLDADGAYETTLTPTSGTVRVTVVETLTGASPRTTTHFVSDGQTVDTSWEFYASSAYDLDLALIDGGTP